MGYPEAVTFDVGMAGSQALGTNAVVLPSGDAIEGPSAADTPMSSPAAAARTPSSGEEATTALRGWRGRTFWGARREATLW
jgi:hypothetical protein